MLHGIDTGTTIAPINDDYSAVTSIVQRVQPDIICFQELTQTDKADWLTAGGHAGLSVLRDSDLAGHFPTVSCRASGANIPITNIDQIKETLMDPTAAEITRWPLHAEIEVPGALNPFHVFVVHNKSGTTTKAACSGRSKCTGR